ncbi:MAG: hypothetical protein V1495_03290 [Pseudomonadota bacterium]
MPERRDDEPKERLSWREIDQRRDGSFHVRRDPAEERPKRDFEKRQDSAALKALEGFFQGKKSKEQEEEWKKVLGGSPKNFSIRASAYVEKNGLPKQWDDLLRLLDHRDAAFVGQVLDRLMKLAENETPSRLELLNGKLRILKMEREEPDLLARIEKILSDLAGKL